ncbi:MAG: hypothetical protein DMG59_09290 [Acidobacteria bacterium]|nr:MAG: hypothetical protein DMG59_09290 [Acidobacteriota bacterium]
MDEVAWFVRPPQRPAEFLVEVFLQRKIRIVRLHKCVSSSHGRDSGKAPQLSFFIRFLAGLPMSS